MTWFAFKNDGSVYNLNGIAEKELAATFAHGYATEAQALAKPNSPASAAQATLLASFVTAASSPAGGGISGVIQIATVNPSGQNTGQIGPTNNPAVNAATGGAGGLLNWPSFTNTRSFMVRVVKVVLGGALILAGITMLVKKETGISAGDVAKVAGVAAV